MLPVHFHKVCGEADDQCCGSNVSYVSMKSEYLLDMSILPMSNHCIRIQNKQNQIQDFLLCPPKDQRPKTLHNK